jgi:hypothetical protein
MITKKWTLSVLALSLVGSLSAAPAFAAGHGEQHNKGNHYGWYKQQVTFQDIDNGFSWAQQAIQQLSSEGVFRGVDSTHFQPAGTLNRAQFAVLVSRYFGLQPANGTQEDFRDVHAGDWYFNDIEAAKDYMTMFVDTQGGYDFNPNQPINRAEAAVTLVQALLKKNEVQLVTPDQANQILSVYSDASLIPQNLRVHVATAVQAGVIKGVALDRFDPLSTLNRAQAATLLYRLQSQLQVLPIDSTTGQPIEVAPGTPVTTTGTTTTGTGTTYTNGPVITYQSSTYNLPVGSQVSVSSSALGAVYLVPTTYAANNVSTLDSLVNSNVASKSTVGQAYTTVALNTMNLAAGNYTVYAVDQYGNISTLGSTITLTGTGSTTTTSPTVTYLSSSYNLNVGDQVAVSSNEIGAVYLIPTNDAPNSVNSLESLVSSNVGTKATVSQPNSGVSLSTSNLAAGNYTIYVTDQYGNIGKYSDTVNLSSASTSAFSGVQLQSRSADTNGVTYATIAVQSTSLANGTPVTVELVNTNGTSLSPAIASQAVINNNTASATLAIPVSVPYGNYLVKVTAGGYTNQSLTFTK